MKEIGGYFNLELTDRGGFLHDDGMLFNSCRNSLEIVLRSIGKIKCLWLPYYTCDSVLQPIIELKVEHKFYHINENLEIEDFPFNEDDYLLYTNYFGIKDDYVLNLSKKYGQRLIVDNAQSFYSIPIKGVNTIYSPRKFFGVPDGGIAYLAGGNKENSLERDLSFDRCLHLLKRYDEGASSAYMDFKDSEKRIGETDVKQMSVLTEVLLRSIDFKSIKNKRLNNFNYLHKFLANHNELKIDVKNIVCPLVYPFMIKDGDKLREKLISEKIFVATYWPNVFEWCDTQQLEGILAKKILALPIDQRYDNSDMNLILDKLRNNNYE
jgi:hypothetical protein